MLIPYNANQMNRFKVHSFCSAYVVGGFMAYPNIWSLLDEFKSRCRTRGWKAYENDDLIEAEGEAHKFFWTRNTHASTFKQIVADSSCSVLEDVSVRTVSFSYKAWILIDKPSWDIWLYMIKEASHLLRTVALFDLSQARGGEHRCMKLNETKSVVFQEFERFVREEHGIEFRSLTTLPAPPQNMMDNHQTLASSTEDSTLERPPHEDPESTLPQTTGPRSLN
jgi:hypothetical protein